MRERTTASRDPKSAPCGAIEGETPALRGTRQPGPFARILWLAGGWLALGAGMVGVVVPLLPTTVFLILAAFCFARGSDRMHDWLVNHPTFGPMLADWRNHRAISRRGKVLAGIAMLAVLAISVALDVPIWVIALQAVILTAVASFLFTRPLPPRDLVKQGKPRQ